MFTFNGENLNAEITEQPAPTRKDTLAHETKEETASSVDKVNVSEAPKNRPFFALKKIDVTDSNQAQSLLNAIGVSALFYPESLYVGILEANVRDKLGLEIAYSETPTACTVTVGEKSWTGLDKEEAAKKAILDLRKEHFRHFLIAPPSTNNDLSPTRNLQKFLHDFSIYQQHTLQEKYIKLPNQLSCTLSFLNIELGIGIGVNSEAAKDAAASNAIAKLEKAISLLDLFTPDFLITQNLVKKSVLIKNFLAAFGISPIHFTDDKSSWVERIIDLALTQDPKATRADIAAKFFSIPSKLTKDRYISTCTMEEKDHVTQTTGQSSTQDGAKACAAKAMMMNSRYNNNFKIKVPFPCEPGTARITLMAFLKEYSFYWSQGMRLEDTYTTRIDNWDNDAENPLSSMRLLYECETICNGAIETGIGSTKEAASENAACNMLKKLKQYIEESTPDVILALSTIFSANARRSATSTSDNARRGATSNGVTSGLLTNGVFTTPTESKDTALKTPTRSISHRKT